MTETACRPWWPPPLPLLLPIHGGWWGWLSCSEPVRRRWGEKYQKTRGRVCDSEISRAAENGVLMRRSDGRMNPQVTTSREQGRHLPEGEEGGGEAAGSRSDHSSHTLTHTHTQTEKEKKKKDSRYAPLMKLRMIRWMIRSKTMPHWWPRHWMRGRRAGNQNQASLQRRGKGREKEGE
jgi:hypothetical protein